MLHDRHRIAVRALGAVAVLAVAAAFTVACRPEPAATPEPSASVSPRPTGATPTPIETELPGAGFEVPTACEDIYSAAMLDGLEAENPPLNDPGVTISSTQNVDLLEILDAGEPPLRCSWGPPGEFGLVTNVTAVDADTAALIEQQLGASGFECGALGEGTICRIESKGVTQDDNIYYNGEIHYLGGGGWVSTLWINFDPEGYAEDIVATIWGA